MFGGRKRVWYAGKYGKSLGAASLPAGEEAMQSTDRGSFQAIGGAIFLGRHN